MMEKVTTEEASPLIACPEADLECDCRQISLSNKSSEIVNRNGVIDKHVGKKPNDVFANNEEHLSNCSSDLRFMVGEQSVAFQSDYVENSIISSSIKHGSGKSSSEPVDGIEIKAKEPTDPNSRRSSNLKINEVTEISEDENRENTEIPSVLFSKLIIKDSKQDKEIVFVQYKSEDQLPDLVALITVDLSEPYSVYTYRYFLHNWPHLSHLAYHGNQCVGAIVCKLDIHRKNVLRGYIAMLVVHKSFRRWKIGSSLVRKAVAKMINHGCEEVVLETEVTNKAALKLYENLGFVRDKRLLRYYLNGVDAWRLKLWLK